MHVDTLEKTHSITSYIYISIMVNKLVDCVYAAVATYMYILTSLIHVLDNNWISCLQETNTLLYYISLETYAHLILRTIPSSSLFKE